MHVCTKLIDASLSLNIQCVLCYFSQMVICSKGTPVSDEDNCEKRNVKKSKGKKKN